MERKTKLRVNNCTKNLAKMLAPGAYEQQTRRWAKQIVQFAVSFFFFCAFNICTPPSAVIHSGLTENHMARNGENVKSSRAANGR